jgi:hypothetical protein
MLIIALQLAYSLQSDSASQQEQWLANRSSKLHSS